MKPKTALQIVREKRLKLGLTQIQLATKTGIFHSVISRLENGYGVPNANSLRKLAGPLGLDADMLIRLANEERAENHKRRGINCGHKPPKEDQP